MILKVKLLIKLLVGFLLQINMIGMYLLEVEYMN